MIYLVVSHIDIICQQQSIAPILLASLIGAGASLVGGAVSGIIGSRNTRNTNSTNRLIQAEANQANLDMMREQNAWNREQWNLENEYNLPVNQVHRLEQAGINPLWALSGGDPGNAQSITSASGSPMGASQMRAYQPDLSFIGDAVSGVVNSLIQSGELGVKGFEAQTHRAAQESEADRNAASAEEARAQASALRLRTKWDEASFDIRLSQASQTLKNLEAEYGKIEANTEESRAKKAEIDESKKLISERITEVRASIRQRDRELEILAMNASTNRQQLALEGKRLQLEGFKFKAQCQKWDNDTIMQYIYKFSRTISGEASASVGLEGLGLKGKAGIEEKSPADIQKMALSGIKMSSAVAELLDRAAENPTPENLQQASDAEAALLEIDSYLQSVMSSAAVDDSSSPDGVVNDVPGLDTFGSWSPWQ